VKGTRACQESSGLAQAYGPGVLRDPWNMARAGLPEAQSPDDASRHPPERRLDRCRALRWYCSFAGATFGVRAMPSEGIQGDEWAAYVLLARTTGTNVGSPTGRESYGDGGLVVVAGVTTCQGGRESRPQGEADQVTGVSPAGR
jgi:hypothetical protein